MKLLVGSDHGGFTLKGHLLKELEKAGHQVTDAGAYTADSVDYPDIAAALAKRVAEGEFERGIIVCGTGQGVAITANKVHGVRAAVVSDTFSAKMARAHNDANVLCLGERVVGSGLAMELVTAFLATAFEGGRHATRVDKIRQLDSQRAGGGGSKC
jgi:ribose 5-phosphate isomerase B